MLKNNPPKISVLMSIYNGAKYLKEAVDSILNQTFTNFEFIIINDGSTDATDAILKSYSDPRLKIIANPVNLGLTKSLNIGLNAARGEYIARQDTDDISLPNRLEIQFKFMENHKEISLVGGSAILIDNQGEEIGRKIKPLEFSEIKFHSLLKNPFFHPSFFFKKEVIKKNGGYNENFPFAQDYELTSRLIHSGLKTANLREPLIKYRVMENSITGNKETRKIQLELALRVSFNNCSRYLSLKEPGVSSLIKGVNRQKTGLLEMLKNLYNFHRLKKSFFKKENLSAAEIKKIKKICHSEQKNIIVAFLKPSVKL